MALISNIVFLLFFVQLSTQIPGQFDLSAFPHDGIDFSKNEVTSNFDLSNEEDEFDDLYDGENTSEILREFKAEAIYAYVMFFVRLFVGIFIVATIVGIGYLLRRCYQRRIVGFVRLQNILVVVEPSRSRDEEQTTRERRSTASPPPYEEAVVIPPLPTASEILAKKENS